MPDGRAGTHTAGQAAFPEGQDMGRRRRIIVIGGGGHAKVVIGTLRAAGHCVTAVFDDDGAKVGKEILGVLVAGPLAAIHEKRYPCGVIAIGDNATRRRLAGALELE